MSTETKRPRRWVAAALAAILGSPLAAGRAAMGQGPPSREPLMDQLLESFQREYLTLGILLQVVGDLQPERTFAGNSGFSIANARVRVAGELDGGFGYLVRANLAGSPSILDAALHYRIAQPVTIQAGLFKAPFSREFLTNAGSIDFVNRSQVVSALAPGRQIGMQLSGRADHDAVEYSVGAFNGNRFGPNGNDNDGLLYVGRIGVWPRVFGPTPGADRLGVGFNLGFSRDQNAPVGNGFLTAFRGDRTLYGADVLLTRGELLLSAEIIGARLAPPVGPAIHPFGWHATAGYKITPKSQLLLRLDSFRPDGVGPDQDLVVLGYNLWPTRPTELQVNYIIPLQRGAVDRNQILINVQVGF